MSGSDWSVRCRLAWSLRAALDECGVTFVKIGQLLSTRRDLLPAEFVEELTSVTCAARSTTSRPRCCR